MNDSTHEPPSELEDLILRSLHGIADEAEGAALATQLAASSEARELFADLV